MNKPLKPEEPVLRDRPKLYLTFWKWCGHTFYLSDFYQELSWLPKDRKKLTLKDFIDKLNIPDDISWDKVFLCNEEDDYITAKWEAEVLNHAYDKELKEWERHFDEYQAKYIKYEQRLEQYEIDLKNYEIQHEEYILEMKKQQYEQLKQELGMK